MKLSYLSLSACVVVTSGYHELQNRNVALSVILPTGIGQK